jgi:hypothetical protein
MSTLALCKLWSIWLSKASVTVNRTKGCCSRNAAKAGMTKGRTAEGMTPKRTSPTATPRPWRISLCKAWV